MNFGRHHDRFDGAGALPVKRLERERYKQARRDGDERGPPLSLGFGMK
jgi:hypothetical protein